MSTRPRIFIETSALKYASERVLRAYRIPKTIRWGSADVTIPMLRCYAEYPNEALGWRRRHQWLQTMALPILAWLAARGRVELLCTESVEIELRGLPKTDDPRGLFYGAPITWVRPPSWRVSAFTWLVGPFVEDEHSKKVRRMNGRERQLDFLASVEHPRFIELQKAAGAYQGNDRRPHPNQLLDAFHLWSAEVAKADYFVTLDDKLLRHLEGHRSHPPKVVWARPIQLVKALEKVGVYSWRDLPDYARARIRQARHPQTRHPLEAEVEMTRHYDRLERPSRWKRWFGVA